MKPLKIIGLAALTLALATATFDIGKAPNTVTVGFVSKAGAVVGRPLTPVSYAGVARRTARRCAAGVYYC